MKSIIETSFYLLIFTIISYACIDYISMNMSISRYSELQRYVKDYMDIYGEETDDSLDPRVITKFTDLEERSGVDIQYQKIAEDDRYSYYRLDFTYSVKSNLLNIKKSHTATRYAKVNRNISH